MRIAVYVETDVDGPDAMELLLSVYVDTDDDCRMTRHSLLNGCDVPSRVAEAVADALSSAAPTA